MANFAQRLRQQRTTRKLTQTRLAESLAVSSRAYSRWETGKDVSSETTIKNPELNRLCRKVDQLSDDDQKALVVVLDSLVKRSRVSRVMAET